MSENAFTQPQTTFGPTKQEVAESTPGVISAARWFWWIAGLSLVNTLLIHGGSDTNFVVGLGFTMITDVAFQSIKGVAFAIDAVALIFFFLMGRYAQRGHVWAFVVGGVVYLGDALIYLVFQDFMPLAFHGLALFYIGRGAWVLRASLKEAETLVFSAPAPEPVTAASAVPPQLPQG
jgi:hypothetical protein